MTDFLKIAKSIAVHFAHICAYGVETVNMPLCELWGGRNMSVHVYVNGGWCHGTLVIRHQDSQTFRVLCRYHCVVMYHCVIISFVCCAYIFNAFLLPRLARDFLENIFKGVK